MLRWRATETKPSPEEVIRGAFLVVLWREPSEKDIRDGVRAMEAGQSAEDLMRRLVSSTELRGLLDAVREGGDDMGRRRRAVSQKLDQLGGDREFVELTYRCLLGRKADEEGRAFYVGSLASGHSRLSFVESILRSEEFEARQQILCPHAGFVPRDEQLCELANPAKWDNPDWLSLLRSL